MKEIMISHSDLIYIVSKKKWHLTSQIVILKIQMMILLGVLIMISIIYLVIFKRYDLMDT